MAEPEGDSRSDLEELISIIRGAPGVQALRATYAMHRDKADPVDIDKLLQAAPAAHVDAFCGAVLRCLPEVPAFAGAAQLDEAEWEALRIAGEFAQFAQRALGSASASSSALHALARRLHDALPAAPPPLHAALLRALTPLLAAGADVADHALPALLARSFGDSGPQGDAVRPPTAADVRRVYAARANLNGIDLRAGGPSDALRNLLLRCPSALLYLRVADGQKFLAFLLTLKQISHAIFDAIMLQLTTARKSQANSIGEVFLLAWRSKGVDRFRATLINLVEKAIVASSEPLATNLRTVLSIFHLNRRLPMMDSMLHRVYGPTLQRNLMVANPLVRRNAVMILCDAYPVHDPEASHADIETAIYTQTDKILSLLDDPAPVVRTVTVQGVCRILTLYIEVVPAAKSKRMIDIITSKLAFDSTSAAVRIAAFEGLKAMLDNHATHELLKVTLPRLRPLIHDNVERVRLAFLDLLVKLKAKRIVNLPYFSVVPVNELLSRLPDDSPAVVGRIMELIVTLYFPLEKSGKSQKEIRQSQVRACRSMVTNNPLAASCFYKRLRFYVPPGPLVTFSMSISSDGINAADKKKPLKQSQPEIESPESVPTRRLRTAKRKESQKKRARRSKSESVETNAKENNRGDENAGASQTQPEASQLLAVAADVLQSLTPALGKESNRELRDTVDAVYKPSDMKSYLVQRKYTRPTRTAVWRIASCVSPKKANSIVSLWRQELCRVGDSLYECRSEKGNSERLDLLAALISCGIAWNKIGPLGAVLAEWADQIEDNAFAEQAAALKKEKKKKKQKKGRTSKKIAGQPQFPDAENSATKKSKALYALVSVVDVLTKDAELREQFLQAFNAQTLQKHNSENDEEDGEEPVQALTLVSTIRRGCQAAVDNLFLEDATEDEDDLERRSAARMLALFGLSAAWKMLLLVLSSSPRARSDDSDAQSSGSRVAEDFHALLDWSTNPEFFAAAAVSPSENDFCASFAAVWLAHCADTVCLGQFPDNGLLALEKFVQGACFALSSRKGSNMVRVLAELLRIAYQLGEHAAYTAAAAGPEAKQDTTPLLLQVRDSVAKSTLNLIASIRVGDDGALSGGQPMLIQSLGELLSGLGTTFDDVSGKALQTAFDDAEDDKQSLLAALLAGVLRRHATRSDRSWSVLRGSALLRSCFGALAETGAVLNAARLIKFATENVFEEGVPLEGARAVDAFSALTNTLRDLLNCVAELPGCTEDEATVDEIGQARESVQQMEVRDQRLRSGEEATPVKPGLEEYEES